MNSETLYMIAVMGFVWLILVAAMAFLPYYTRKSIAFGIAVPPEQNKGEFLTGLKRHYVRINLIMGVVFTALVLFAMLRVDENVAMSINLAAIFLYIVLSFVVFARCHNIVRDFKRNSDWVIQSQAAALIAEKGDTRKLFSPLWYLSYVAVTVAVAVYSLILYPTLPARLPMNFDFSGAVTNWADTSYWTLMQMPLVMLLLTLMFAAIGGFIVNGARRKTDDANLKRGLHNNRSFQIIMGRSMFWLGALILAITAAGQLSILQVIDIQVVAWLTFALLAIIPIGICYLVVAVGQGGYRLSAGKADSIPADVDGSPVADDDQNWVFFGTFYNNPDDPTLFPERRIGLGWTLNIGRPAGKVILAAVILLVAAIIALIVLMPGALA